MIGKYLAALFVFAVLSCHVARAEYESEAPCGQLLSTPASFTEPPYIIDDPSIPPPDMEQPTPASSRQYLNVDAQWMHGVQRLRWLHNVYGEGSVVGVWDEAAVFGDHYQFWSKKGVARVRPLWSKKETGIFGDDPQCKDDQTKKCYSQHSTHVAGTIASSGISDSKGQYPTNQPARDPQLSEGMAPRVGIYSFNWDKDAMEVCRAATGEGGVLPIHVSNHSYGPILGWKWDCTQKDAAQKSCLEITWTWLAAKNMDEARAQNMTDPSFGQYNYYNKAADFDRLIYSRTNLSVFRSAGNNRRDDPTKKTGWWDKYRNVYRWSNGVEFSLDKNVGPKNGEYGLVAGAALAKNVITIGAVYKIPEAVGSGPEKITSGKLEAIDFSSAGPRADGGIKPDLVAAGGALYSPTISDEIIQFSDITEEDKHYYKNMSGTSMATPAAAGIGALLNEVALHKLRRVLRADEMKAILIHTAINNSKNNINTDAPNYETGWGSIRADYAGWILDRETARRNANSTERKRWIGVYEDAFPGAFLVQQSEAKTPYSLSLEHIPGKDVRVTLVWLDAPGPRLVKDLDLVVRGPTNLTESEGMLHKVWCLDKDHPAKAAEQCERNNIDNVERVDVKAGVEPREGTWTIKVNHVNGSESIPFALVISGLKRKGEPVRPEQESAPEQVISGLKRKGEAVPPEQGPAPEQVISGLKRKGESVPPEQKPAPEQVISGLKRKGEPVPPEQEPSPEPGSPPLPSQACRACYDIELRERPSAASPGKMTVFQCDPVHILRYDRYTASWAYVSFAFAPFPSAPGFPGISPGGPYPWNRGWAPRASIACRGDRYRCHCGYLD